MEETLEAEILKFLYFKPELIALDFLGKFHLIINSNLIIPAYIIVVLILLFIKHNVLSINAKRNKPLKFMLKVSQERFKMAVVRLQHITSLSLIILFFLYTYFPEAHSMLSKMLQEMVLAIIICTIVLYKLTGDGA